MRKILAGVAGAICLGLFASVAQAAPFGAAGGASSAVVPSEIVPVHGLHTSCQRDRHGWHRSYIWGRVKCAPRHTHRHKHKHHHRKHHHKKKKH